MASLTDETLMAYADGELDPQTRAEVEAALAQNPQARKRLEIFVATGAPLAKLFNRPLNEPAPAHLVALIEGARQTPRASGARDRPSRARDAIERLLLGLGGPRWAIALACGVSVLIGLGAFLHYRQVASDGLDLVALDRGQIFAQGPLRQALETAVSGKQISFGNEGSPVTVESVLTFKNRRQAYCRQYEVKTPKNGYAGIACRDDDGRWQIEIHIVVAPNSPPRDHIAPAGKAVSNVETAVGKVIEGDALGRDDEQALIQNNWRS